MNKLINECSGKLTFPSFPVIVHTLTVPEFEIARTTSSAEKHKNKLLGPELIRPNIAIGENVFQEEMEFMSKVGT